MSSVDTMPMAPERPAESRRKRDVIVLVVLFGFVLAGLVGLAAATGWEETKIQLAKLGWGQISILLMLSLVNYLFRAGRWHLFSHHLGLNTTWVQSVRHFIGGFAMSVTPGRVGELIRMRWIERETGWAFVRTAPLVLVDRASDLAAMAVLLAMGVTLGAGGIAYGIPVAILALTAAFVATRPALLETFGRDRLFANRPISPPHGAHPARGVGTGYFFKTIRIVASLCARHDWLVRRGLRLSSLACLDGRRHRAVDGHGNLHLFDCCWRPDRCTGRRWWGRSRYGSSA